MNSLHPSLPPKTLLRLKKLWPYARSKGHRIGELRRVGFYSKQDGLDCIWLVSDFGKYDWTADHSWVLKHFEIVELSDCEDFFGDRSLALKPRNTAEQGAAANP